MATYINTNITSLSTQNVLSKSQNELSKSIHRLSTGLRVNSAIDDASGYAIANRLNSQLRGQTVAVRNTNDAISFSQYKEPALSTMHDSLQRMRELAVQSSSGTIGEEERNLLNAEFLQLQQEISRVQNNSYYNGTNALSNKSVTVQVGADNTAFDKIQVQGFSLDKLTAAANTGEVAAAKAPLATTYTKSQFEDLVKTKVASGESASNWYYNATNGHIYKYVQSGLTSASASSAAAALSLTGVSGVEDQSGYLVTITNGAENSFVASIVSQRGTAWINVNDRATEGTYKIDGNAPTDEANTQIKYSNYAAGEPNNYWGLEDSTQMYTNGQWNDLFETSVLPYVVEFGGKTINTTSSSQINTVRPVTVAASGSSGTAAVTTAEVNGMWQWQATTSITISGTGDSAYFDQYGIAYKGGDTLSVGQFVYTKQTAVGTAVPTTGITGTLSGVAGVPQSTAASTQALISANAGGVNILSQLDSQQAISIIDGAMQQVEVAQIQEGATQSRLNTIVSTLTATNESLTKARSTILDTDYAAETAALARAQILQQAGIAMLAQANQLGQSVLKLLQ